MLVEPNECLPPHAIRSKDQTWNLKPLSGPRCDPMILQLLQIRRKAVQLLVPEFHSLMINLGYPCQAEIVGGKIPIGIYGIDCAKCLVVNTANGTIAVLDID